MICNRCKRDKDVSEFGKDKTKKSGLMGRCKDCCKVNKPSGSSWGRHIKHKYGLTEGAYNEMFEKQDGKCAICESTPDSALGKFSIDHCHSTGKIRGLLCSHCNKGLGYFRDSVANLQQAAKYLG